MYRPYGAGEMNMFNFAYNLLTLKFKKANQQLPNDVLKRTLHYMNIGLCYFPFPFALIEISVKKKKTFCICIIDVEFKFEVLYLARLFNKEFRQI